MQGGRAIELVNYIHRYQLAFQSIYRSVNSMMKEHVHTDITTDQFTVLQFIHQQEKVTSTQISQAMGVRRSAITALVNRLVERAFVQRERNKKDRRIVYLTLTETGTHVVKETENAIHLYLTDKLTHFSIEDIEGFLLSIEKLATLMNEDKGDEA